VRPKTPLKTTRWVEADTILGAICRRLNVTWRPRAEQQTKAGLAECKLRELRRRRKWNHELIAVVAELALDRTVLGGATPGKQ
jgi:hypothetical protein